MEIDRGEVQVYIWESIQGSPAGVLGCRGSVPFKTGVPWGGEIGGSEVKVGGCTRIGESLFRRKYWIPLICGMLMATPKSVCSSPEPKYACHFDNPRVKPIRQTRRQTRSGYMIVLDSVQYNAYI